MDSTYLLGNACPECGWPSYTQDKTGGIICNGCGHVVRVGTVEELEPEPETASLTQNTVWKYTAVDPLLIREERWDEMPFPDDSWSPICSQNTLIELEPLDLTQDITHVRLFNECLKSTSLEEGRLGTNPTKLLKDLGIEITSIFAKFDHDTINTYRNIDPFLINSGTRQDMDVLIIRTSDGYYFISDINTVKLSSVDPMLSEAKANLRLALLITTINPITAAEYK